MRPLDGNVLAGPVSGLFAFDATSTRAQCDGCGDVAMIAQAMVYGEPMGYVVRCRLCDSVLLVVVERARHRLLSMPGVRWLRIDTQDDGPAGP